MATLTDLSSRIDSAIAAMDALDYASAQRHAQAALLMMVAIPDSTFDGNDQIRFDRQGANEILKSIKRDAAAHLASQNSSQEIVYERG